LVHFVALAVVFVEEITLFFLAVFVVAALMREKKAAVVGIYDGSRPVATAVFFSPSRALTVYHDAKPTVGDFLTAKSVKPKQTWKLKVVEVSMRDDLVVLELVEGTPVPVFIPLAPEGDIDALEFEHVAVLTFGIAAASKAAEKAGDIQLGALSVHTEVSATGKRHFIYPNAFSKGDSGGAVMDGNGNLVGIHLGGWNDTSPAPASPPKTKSKTSLKATKAISDRTLAKEVGALIKQQNRLVQLGLAEAGSRTVRSVAALAERLTLGGYAIFLGRAKIRALANSSSKSNSGVGKKDKSGRSSSAAGGVVAGGTPPSGVGAKRKRGDSSSAAGGVVAGGTPPSGVGAKKKRANSSRAVSAGGAASQ
jgi:hypothetical protein